MPGVSFKIRELILLCLKKERKIIKGFLIEIKNFRIFQWIVLQIMDR